MSARNSVVSIAGMSRCRPAHASGTPSGPRITTPRSGAPPPPTASASRVNSSWAGNREAVAPRSASRRACVTASESVASRVRAALAHDPRLLVPVGTCEQHGPHLPLGCDTIIVERLADDLSARFGILRAPTVEYGVNTATKVPYPGNAAVRRKTLHRWLNDLVGARSE